MSLTIQDISDDEQEQVPDIRPLLEKITPNSETLESDREATKLDQKQEEGNKTMRETLLLMFPETNLDVIDEAISCGDSLQEAVDNLSQHSHTSTKYVQSTGMY